MLIGTGLMILEWLVSSFCIFQSLAKSHITIHPSQYQVTVNPQNGRKERVFVDLRAIYPTPEEPGTELCFAEVWAARRGLLTKSWADSEGYRPSKATSSPILSESRSPSVDLLTEAVSTKLIVHHDQMLDENGAVKDHSKEGRPKKK